MADQDDDKGAQHQPPEETQQQEEQQQQDTVQEPVTRVDGVEDGATDPARDRVEASSSERTASLKSARQAALSGTYSADAQVSTYASRPPPSTSSRYNDFPPPPSYPPPAPPSSLFNSLKRLTYILSFVLGSSAIVGLFTSTFLLPLLNATFSARRSISEQQRERFTALVSGLRALRSSSLYAPPREETAKGKEQGGLSEAGDEEKPLLPHRESRIEELASTTSSSAPENHDQPSPEDAGRPSPLPDLSALTTSLRTLSDGVNATATTRESLLSTLEGYTAVLHRQVYLRGTGSGRGMSVGLSTLSSNLANAEGKKSGEIDMGGRGAEWDDVRKEVRAIKGMLLGRRSFAPITAG